MSEIIVLGLLIRDRVKEAGLVQKVLTKYAPVIKTRLGFHEVNEDVCSRIGMILVQLKGTDQQCKTIEEEFRSIGGVEIQKMIFNK